MVTAGANQAFVNLVLALLDPQDAAVLFAPYYFNHMMALQVMSLVDISLPLCMPFPPWHLALRSSGAEQVVYCLKLDGNRPQI